MSKQEIDAIFDAALELPAEERATFLDRRCPSGPVREAVDRLLRGSVETDLHLRTGGGIGGPLGDALWGDMMQPGPLRPDERVGPFRVVSELGRGGMAVVYLAERADGEFRQRVALKVVRSVASRSRDRERFRLERQILASLEHPNIARLLDGGHTDDGRPYFAMEVVDGLPIDRYCDENRLPIDDRLHLFLDVTRAIESAHRSLVVHRDIKPSNILVSEGGQVKLLDFGIAKLLDATGVASAPALTRTAVVAMTPEVASPEQFRGDPVTTASDIYQLGLLLYELLSGLRPYSLEGLSLTAVWEQVCELLPTRPSTALQHLAKRSGEAAGPTAETSAERIGERRGCSPERLWRTLEGDLDTIVMMALRKEPERRYGSVGNLADDIERCLVGRPVLARGDTWTYRTRKFVGRHRLAVSAAAAVALLVAGLVLFYTVQLGSERNAARTEARRAAAARDQAVAAREEAEQVVELLVDLFRVSDPEGEAGGGITARELLEQGAAKIRDQLPDQPLIRARLMATIGKVYLHLAVFEEARMLLEEAVSTQRRFLGAGHPDLAATLSDLALLTRLQGRYEEAEPLYRRALGIRLKRLGPTHDDTVASYQNLANLFNLTGRFDEAIPLYQRSLAVREERGGDPLKIAVILQNLGGCYWEQGRFDEAEPLLLRALAIREQAFGPDHTKVADSLNNIAILVKAQGRYDEAESLFHRALTIEENALGPEHPDVAVPLQNLAELYLVLERYPEAERHSLRARGLREKALGPEHPDLAATLSTLGDLRRRQGRLAEAESHLRRALAIVEKKLGPETIWSAFCLGSLATVYRDQRRFAAAEPLYRRAMAILEVNLQPDHPELVDLLAEYAELLATTGRDDAAKALRSRIAG